MCNKGVKVKGVEIKNKALELGYLACGIIPAIEFHEYTQHLDKRINKFPESKELYEPLYRLASPAENAKSIIVCIQRYNRYKIPDCLEGLIGKCYLFDSRIPYSKEFRAKTEFEEHLKINRINFLESNIPDRLAAAKAGLGKIGANNFFYSPNHGSYVWIDKWVTDVQLDYDPIQENIFLSECNNCQNCVRSCPTKALQGEFLMDRGKCITQFLSYPKEALYQGDTLKKETWLDAGIWLYGCDSCQDACHLNKDKFIENEMFPLLADFTEYLKPENILEMDNATYLSIVNPRFWYVGKDGLWRWKCMALRSMINSGNIKYHGYIKKYCDDNDLRLREIAQWGLTKIEKANP